VVVVVVVVVVLLVVIRCLKIFNYVVQIRFKNSASKSLVTLKVR